MADYYSLDDAVAPAAAAPPAAAAAQGYYSPDDAAPPAVAPAPAPASMGTPGYIGMRLLDSLLGSSASFLRAKTGLGLPDSGTASANKTLTGSEALPPANGAAQRYLGDLAGAVGANPPAAMAFPAATIGGSLASTGASDANKAAGGVVPDWLARLVGGFAGGTAAPYAVSKGANAVTAARTAAADLGVAPNAAINKNLANTAKFDSTPLGQFQADAGSTAAAVGDEATPRVIGQNLVKKATDWLAARKTANDTAYNILRGKMPNPADTSNSSAFVQNIPKGPKPPALLGDFRARMADTNEPPPDFGELQRWRTSAKELLDSSNAAGSRQTLGDFRDALTKDMEATARAHGGQPLVDEWKGLDAGYRDDKQAVRSAFGVLPGKTTTPEEAFAQLGANPQQNLTKLKTLLDKGVIGDNDVRNIASHQFYRLNANQDGLADPTLFARNMIRMRQEAPETVDFLFRRTPTDRTAFDAYLNRATALHLGSGNATQAQAKQAANALVEFAKRTGRAAAIGSIGKMVPGVGTAAELAGTLAGLGEGAPPGVAPLLQAPRPSFTATPAGRAFLQSLVTAPNRQTPSGQPQ